MKKNKWFMVSPFVMAGVLLALLPVFTVMTVDRLNRQKQFLTQGLLEKGISLIRTFEAGTRAGMLKMRWGGAGIQDMLLETTSQPEVVFMMIVSQEGKILAHSDAGLVGQQYANMPESGNALEDPSVIRHRIVEHDKERVFEVYKRFFPLKGRFGHGPMRMTRMRQFMENQNAGEDWARMHLPHDGNDRPDQVHHYIIAGLSMKNTGLAHSQLIKETIRQGILYLLLGGACVFALFVFQAYRSAQASLTSVTAYADTVIENMPSGLVTIASDGRITGMNEAAGRILGSSPDRVSRVFESIVEKLGPEQGVMTLELPVQDESGNKILLDVTASRISGRESQADEYLFLFKDLTQIKELKQQVETNRRLAAIGKLAAGVAHEIRNPLSSIKGFAAYFGQRCKDRDEDREMAGIMVKEVDRINRSITQLLEFAKPLSIEKSQVDIKELVSHSIKLVDHDLDKKKIKVQCDINIDSPFVYTDGDRINQVLLNLYMNAVEAMDENGTLAVSVTMVENGELVIQVSDTGCGIKDEDLENIFDPYFTTRPTGTGLGLSIVHRIIENLGGTIKIDSAPEKGSCFTIRLPKDQ